MFGVVVIPIFDWGKFNFFEWKYFSIQMNLSLKQQGKIIEIIW